MFFQAVRKGDNAWFLWVSTIFLVILGYFIGQFPLYGVVYSKINQRDDLSPEIVDDFFANPDFSIIGLNSNIGLMLLILIFVFALIGLYIGVKYLHKRAFLSLVYYKEKIRLNRLLFGFGFWFVAMICIEFLSLLFLPATYYFEINYADFIPLVFISILFLPIQTSAEELVLRGYLMQGIGYFANNKIIALVVTTILFGLMHGLNPEIDEYGFWPMMFYYLSAGLFLGIITIMDDGLELALGTHAAINIFGATMVSYQGGAIQTDTLFKVSQVYPLAMTGGFIVAGILFVILAKRKFVWPDFGFMLVEPQDIISLETSQITEEIKYENR